MYVAKIKTYVCPRKLKYSLLLSDTFFIILWQCWGQRKHDSSPPIGPIKRATVWPKMCRVLFFFKNAIYVWNKFQLIYYITGVYSLYSEKQTWRANVCWTHLIQTLVSLSLPFHAGLNVRKTSFAFIRIFPKNTPPVGKDLLYPPTITHVAELIWRLKRLPVKRVQFSFY